MQHFPHWVMDVSLSVVTSGYREQKGFEDEREEPKQSTKGIGGDRNQNDFCGGFTIATR